MEVKDLLNISSLLTEAWNNKRKIMKIYKKYDKEIREYIEKTKIDEKEYISINWHKYSWFNLFYLRILNKPTWIWWTFKQLKDAWFIVKKGEKGTPILVPFIKKDENWDETCSYFKEMIIFHKNQTNAI